MKNILLIGLGRFGRHVAQTLSQRKHQIMAVDISEERINDILPYVTNAQIGDSTNEQFLSSLGIPDYDVCIVAIGDDFQNSLETTSLLKDLGARLVVARACREVHAKFLLRNGADDVVYPEKEMAIHTAIRYSSERIFDYFGLDDKYAIYNITVPDAWVGKTLGNLNVRKKYNVNIVAIKENDRLQAGLTADTVFRSGQKILALGTESDVQKCFRL